MKGPPGHAWERPHPAGSSTACSVWCLALCGGYLSQHDVRSIMCNAVFRDSLHGQQLQTGMAASE